VSIDFIKKKRRYERRWSFGLYNAYNRANPFTYTLKEDGSSDDKNQKTSVFTVRKQSLIPILPFFSYGFKF
jgi:hypothetical protein